LVIGFFGSNVTPASAAPSGTLSYGLIEGFWIAAGGPADVASIAAAITGHESGFEPGIIQPFENYANTGWGLWQITPGTYDAQFGQDYQLLDPWNNAEQAVAKFKASGNTFAPWTTYADGAYKQYLQNGVAPIFECDPGQYVSINSAPAGTHNVSNPGSRFGPSDPYCNVTSVPVSLYDSHGNLNLFWTGGDNQLHHSYALAGKPWSADANKAFFVVSDPAAVATSTGGLDVFYAIAGGHIQHSYFLGGVWTDNQGLPEPGPIAGTPTAYIDSHGFENVFWRGPSGQLFHDWFNGAWHGDKQLGSNLASDPVAIALPNGGGDVFYRTTANTIQHSYFVNGAWTLNKALPLPGAAVGTPGAYLSTNHHENVFWRGINNQLWHDYWISSTTGWRADAQQGSNLASGPAAIALPKGGGDIFYETTGGGLQHSYFVNDIWTKNKPLQSFNNLDTKPSAALRSGHENVFWIDSSATPWNDWNLGTGWQGPATLPN
jgi:hypothetical protein